MNCYAMAYVADHISEKIGKRIGRNTLYKFLRFKGVILSGSQSPASKYVKKGFFVIKKAAIQHPHDKYKIMEIEVTKVTDEGLRFIMDLVAKDYNPIIN